MKSINKLLLSGVWAVILTCLASCGKGEFNITGSIANAKDSILYFEHNGLDGFKVIDSLKLDETGTFSFDGDRPDAPEFYRLRIDGQIINIAIDSTETVSIKAEYPDMATRYDVKDSYENEKIKELALKQISLQSQCQAAVNSQRTNADSLVNAMIASYKKDVETNYIFKEPMKAYAYFALFQYIVIGNQPMMIFDPAGNKEDNKVFGAVATSWDTFYPGSERGKNLHNIAIRGMKNERIMASRQQQSQPQTTVPVDETGIIDLPLYDRNDRLHHLTDLKGQVVLLYSNVFSDEKSRQVIMQLRDIYNKYHDRGFEIYMVSLDDNRSFWNTQVESLPWINVLDDRQISQSYLAAAPGLPWFFLIDRNNNAVKNAAQVKNLSQEIEALL